MMRRRLIVGAGVLALVGAVAWVIWLCQPRPCRARFEKAREGMTLVEVCATVGGEPGDYTDGRSLTYFFSQSGSVRQEDDGDGSFAWAAEDAFLLVVIDQGRVQSITIGDPWIPAEPFSTRVRRRLGL